MVDNIRSGTIQGKLRASSSKTDANTDSTHSVLPGTKRLSQTFSGFIAGGHSSSGFDLETFTAVNDHNAFRTSISTSTAATSSTTTAETEHVKHPTRKGRFELTENFFFGKPSSYKQKPSFLRIRQQNLDRKPTFRSSKEQRFLSQPTDSFHFQNLVTDKQMLNFALGSTAISQAVLPDDNIDGNVFSGTRNDISSNENVAEGMDLQMGDQVDKRLNDITTSVEYNGTILNE
ncbi:unnamed protein product [Anisakis simplex]|uniref:Uncharacterized protein n=1 Tax=Anisakis simplex TaxID=6269 RepID=A0A0M3JTW6_ANISI|nr:unnamed protein product [Anisakis simplex]